MATLSEQSIGNIVKMRVNGVLKNFIVVQQGRPSTAYDTSCDGTWLLMEDIYEEMRWGTTNNSYENSNIHKYLNNTFVNLFDSDIQSVIKQVKIPYRKGFGTGSTVSSGSNGLSAKIFCLSYTEVGFSSSWYAPVEGAVLSYFNGATDSKRVAYLYYDERGNGSYSYEEWDWWLRTPSKNSNQSVWLVTQNGSAADYPIYTGIRPALVLPGDLSVDGNGNVVIKKKGITGSVIVSGVAKELTGEGFVNIDGVWKSILETYANINGVWQKYTKSIPTPAGNLAVGSSVRLPFNGGFREWIVVQQGRPSTQYDTSCDGTWLLMKHLGDEMSVFGTTNDYATSTVHQYLNSTFLNLFDSSIRNVIKEVKIPYTKYPYTDGTLYTGANGLSTKVFLPSYQEMEKDQKYPLAVSNEGSTLSYFVGAYSNPSIRIATYNGTAERWHIRSGFTQDSDTVCDIGVSGSNDSGGIPGARRRVRPIIILPANTMVNAVA